MQTKTIFFEGFGFVTISVSKDGKLVTTPTPATRVEGGTDAPSHNGGNVADLVSAIAKSKDSHGASQLRCDDNGDEVINALTASTPLYNQHLFKQHVLAQVFKQMTETSYAYQLNADGTREYIRDEHGHLVKRKVGYYEAIKSLSYEKMLQVMTDMSTQLSAQFRQHDPQHEVNSAFYSKELYIEVIEDYIKVLEKQIFSLKTRHCKGKPYKRIAGLQAVKLGKRYHKNMIFTDEIDRIYDYYRDLRDSLKVCRNSKQLCHVWHVFMETHIKIEWNTPTPRCWRQAYMGYGAYWSMQNLVMFHGCELLTYDRNTEVLKGEEAMQYLQRCLLHDKQEGYWFTGALKAMLEWNDIDPKTKLTDWHDAILARRHR